MHRWVYLQLIGQSMPIYDIVQKNIELRRQNPKYQTLVNEHGTSVQGLINELEYGEEMTIEDPNSFPDSYAFILDEERTQLNTEWRNIHRNDYCNQYSSMYLLTKWTQQLHCPKNE
ncbi:unnamed protein product [Rotaria socialis]|uniref:Uncharacterized protein n=1 Tax=Rotaria socialis TaxID=392032 RepID=A0A817SXE3_9BILA|nr:unnamed protein product [Rotaria socialis]CAF3428268.1 unnamed protein product [Rotaria socialis]CAF3775635.1 unnamed protein product [Rotaria socialis]CAF4491731.1 unnamed protein product [Rotaria socialis]CAF4550265.1 unnamed protein product [Rotaria socialis]